MQTTFRVRHPSGKVYDVPEDQLDYVISDGGEVVEEGQAPQTQAAPAAEEERVNVRHPNGKLYNAPKSQLEFLIANGGTLEEDQAQAPNSAPIQSNQPEQPDSLGRTLARSAKSAVAGAVGGLVDTATSLYNLPASLQNANNEMNKDNPYEVDPISGMPVPNSSSSLPPLPIIPSATEAIKEYADEATGGYTNTPKGSESIQKGIEVAFSIASPGGLAKAALKGGQHAVSKVLGALGTTKPAGLAGAGAAGYTTSEASQAGYGAPASIGAGLVAGGVVGGTASAARSLDVKLALAKLTGNSPKNIDLEAVKAAEGAGIDALNTVVNKSKALSNVEQIVGKSPYFGTKYAKKSEALDRSYAEKVDEAIKSVGDKLLESDSSLDTGSLIKDTFDNIKQSIIKEKNELYQSSKSTLPKDATVIPTNTIKQIDELRSNIKTLRPSPAESFLLGYLDDLESGLVIGSGAHKISAPVPVDMLVGSKVSINDIIDWDINAAGAKQQLKSIQQAFKKDLEEYGKKNPEWFKSFSDADKFYGQNLGDNALGSKTVREKIFAQQNPEKIVGSLRDVSDFKAIEQSLGRHGAGEQFFNSIKREKLTDLIMGKVIDPKTEGVSYLGFSKSMENTSNKELIKYLAGDKYKDLENLNKYAKAVIRKNQRNPNPSGTAPTKVIYGAFGSAVTGAIAGGIAGGVTAGVSPLAGAAAIGSGMSWIVNNKKALQWGIEGAKKLAAGNVKDGNIYFNRIERSMKQELGEDFVRQFISLSNGSNKTPKN